MTTKKQAEICVERNLSDGEIVEMTGCHPECVEFVRAWGRGERLQGITDNFEWINIHGGDKAGFSNPGFYRIAPRRIHVKATLPDGTEREAEFPEPVRNPVRGEMVHIAKGDRRPTLTEWCWSVQGERWLRERCVFRTREAALERDKAMIWISSGEAE